MSFQSSPAPKGRCYGTWNSRRRRRSNPCFNPHRPRRAGATRVGRHPLGRVAVSILTGPEGPVLLPIPNAIRCRLDVSILTGPEGPVLHAFVASQ